MQISDEMIAFRNVFLRHEKALPDLNVAQEAVAAYVAALSLPVQPVAWTPTHRHVKRGSTYVVMAEGLMSIDGDLDHEKMVIYRGENGQWWVRPKYEFDDGRFEALPAPPVSQLKDTTNADK